MLIVYGCAGSDGDFVNGEEMTSPKSIILVSPLKNVIKGILFPIQKVVKCGVSIMKE